MVATAAQRTGVVPVLDLGAFRRGAPGALGRTAGRNHASVTGVSVTEDDRP